MLRRPVVAVSEALEYLAPVAPAAEVLGWAVVEFWSAATVGVGSVAALMWSRYAQRRVRQRRLLCDSESWRWAGAWLAAP